MPAKKKRPNYFPPGKGGGREKSKDLDLTVDNRRQHVLKLRMKWPPLSIREIARELKCSDKTVQLDIRFLRNEFSHQYFAETNHATVARVVAELRQMAYQFLSEAESLKPIWKYAMERSALYGRALQAMQNCNNVMMESGIINKVPLKVETTGKDGAPISYEVTSTSIEDRVRKLSEYGVTAAIPLAAEPTED